MNGGGRVTRADALAAAVLWAAVLLIFAPGAGRLGFYYDDSTVLRWLPEASPARLWEAMRGYVPGRNLHYLWQYGIYKLAGDPVANLARLHVLHSALDGLVAAAFFLLLRAAGVAAPAAVLAAGGFAFWPTHGETHFWPYAAPQNLVSTLLVLGFAATTGGFLRGGRGGALWAADAAAFGGALFTYDQTFVVLAGLAALRLWRIRRAGYLLAHLPYAAAGAFFVWLKLRIPAGDAPVLTADAGRLLLANIPATVSGTVGGLWWQRVTPLFETVTAVDWLLAAIAAAAVAGLALRRAEAAGGSPAALLGLAVLGYAAAYLPVWVWHVSQRHHYLPSAALFAGGAVALGAWWQRSGSAARRATTVVLGGGLLALAAACRGESRYWERSFALKRQLFDELRADLRQAEVLALEDFPLLLGPAYFIAPQDAESGPFLLAGRPPERAIAGDVSSSPAPEGVFLYTLASLHGVESFRYYAAPRLVLVRFAGVEGGQLRYSKQTFLPVPYRIEESRQTPAAGPFGLRHFSARRQGEDTLLWFGVRAEVQARRSLAAVVSYAPRGGIYHRWSERNRAGQSKTLPLLLGGSGNYELEQKVRLVNLPAADRLRIEFFEAGPDREARLLGQAETDLT